MKLYIKLIIFVGFILYIMPFANAGESELKITLRSSLISLNPGNIQDTQSLFVSRQVNCQLVRNQGSVFYMDAAESIKYISPLKIALRINKQAKFHDGTPVTASDVIESFKYIMESRNIFRSINIWLDNVEIIDDHTIVFVLKKQIPQFLKVLSSINYTIFKKSFLNKVKNDKSLWKTPMGCGGYKIVSFDDDKIKLIPVAEGMPITFHLIKSNQLDAKEAIKYDVINIDVIEEKNILNEFEILNIFDPTQYYVGLNSKSKLWKNKYDRCKFLYKLDTKKLISSYGQNAINSNDFLPKGTLGYSSYMSFVNQLFSGSKKSTLYDSVISNHQFCLSYLTVSIQDKHKYEYLTMFKNLHKNIHVNPIDSVTKFGKNFSNSSCDAFVFALGSNYFDGYEYLTIFEDNDANFTGIKNRFLSEKIINSQNIQNAEQRAKEYQIIISQIGDLCIIRPLLTVPMSKIYVRKHLKTPGIGLVALHNYYLGNVSR